MRFVIVSQRAKPDPHYSLKDLTGHGRIDILFRCILAACRPLASDQGHIVYCYFKQIPQGWLKIIPDMIDPQWDEISLAAFVQEHWGELFQSGTLEQLVQHLSAPIRILLDPAGSSTLPSGAGVVFLGAQQDLDSNDLEIVQPTHQISLGPRSLLASHAITSFRQMALMTSENVR